METRLLCRGTSGASGACGIVKQSGSVGYEEQVFLSPADNDTFLVVVGYPRQHLGNKNKRTQGCSSSGFEAIDSKSSASRIASIGRTPLGMCRTVRYGAFSTSNEDKQEVSFSSLSLEGGISWVLPVDGVEPDPAQAWSLPCLYSLPPWVSRNVP